MFSVNLWGTLLLLGVKGVSGLFSTLVLNPILFSGSRSMCGEVGAVGDCSSLRRNYIPCF